MSLPFSVDGAIYILIMGSGAMPDEPACDCQSIQQEPVDMQGISTAIPFAFSAIHGVATCRSLSINGVDLHVFS